MECKKFKTKRKNKKGHLIKKKTKKNKQNYKKIKKIIY
jgi:hypothetical protein